MVQLSVIASGVLGLIGGVTGVALPVAYGRTPSYSTGTAIAFGVGITTYNLWHHFGKGYLATSIAKLVDTAIKAQKESIQNLLAESIRERVPAVIGDAAVTKTAIDLAVNLSLDRYATDPQIVSTVLDDLDQRIPYEKNVLLSQWVNQISGSILDTTCSGYFRRFQPILRHSLNRVVATVAANLIKNTTEAAVAQTIAYSAGHPIGTAINTIERLTNSNLNGLINWGVGLARE